MELRDETDFVVLVGVFLLGACDRQKADAGASPEAKPEAAAAAGPEIPAAFRGEWADNCDDKSRVMTLTGTMLSERDGDVVVDSVKENGPRNITVQYKNPQTNVLQTSPAHMTLEDPKAPSTRPVLMWGTSSGEPVYFEKCG